MRDPDVPTSRAPAALAERRIALADGREAALAILEWNRDPAARALHVRYRIAAAGGALAVFDRGVHGDWSGVAYSPGPTATPRIEAEGGDVVLSHAAPAAAAADLRATPLAIEVPAGGAVEGRFIVTGLDAAAARLRWCVGVAPFEPARFRGAQRTPQGTIWLASPDAIAARMPLCTPWYDLAAARFGSAD